MPEPWSTTTEPPPSSAPAHPPPTPGTPARTITRRRTLPGGRAVLGALLVALAVVGVVASHLAATAAPDDRYLVAAADLPAGTLFADAAAVQASFRQVAVDLPADLADGAVHVDTAESLVGRRLLAALTPGDLLLASGLADVGADPGTSTFTFALPSDAAVGGALTPGDHVDVVATVGTGSEATTAYVVRAAPLTGIVATGGGLGGDTLRLTVELARQSDVQALAHALATASVVVVRSPDTSSDAPGPYRFDPQGSGASPAASAPHAGGPADEPTDEAANEPTDGAADGAADGPPEAEAGPRSTVMPDVPAEPAP